MSEPLRFVHVQGPRGPEPQLWGAGVEGPTFGNAPPVAVDAAEAVRGLDALARRHPPDLSGAGLVYLATPYSRFPEGLDAAFHGAARLAARLIAAGVTVYSPIAHTHPIAMLGNLDPRDHAMWMKFDAAMMARADALGVAHLAGWRESRGMALEIAEFEAAGKPVFDIDPESLTATRRA